MKAIYQPKGKAGEYAKWACNFYVGCSNDCEYCYCKKGVLGHTLGKPQVTLKKCFENEEHALKVFQKELHANIEALREHGLFFSFTTDPMLDECRSLTENAVELATMEGVPCTILTKCAFELNYLYTDFFVKNKDLITFGFTLTGHDELEPNASSNGERIACMKELFKLGYKTFASIEPVVDVNSSLNVIINTLAFCEHYKVGLMRGEKNYKKDEIIRFVNTVAMWCEEEGTPVYFKDSVVDFIGTTREKLKTYFNCVEL